MSRDTVFEDAEADGDQEWCPDEQGGPGVRVL